MNRLKHINLIGKGVLSRWIISYFLVMLIPVLICSIAFAQSQSFLRQQITDVNFLLLKQTASRLEDAVADIQRISSDIELNANISDYIYHAEEESGSKQLLNQVRKSWQIISIQQKTNCFCFYIAVDTDTFLTSQGIV